jgi:hypothetical protein
MHVLSALCFACFHFAPSCVGFTSSKLQSLSKCCNHQPHATYTHPLRQESDAVELTDVMSSSPGDLAVALRGRAHIPDSVSYQ